MSITPVALSIKPPEVADAVGNFARIMQLKQMIQNAPLQNQIMQQQAQQGALDVQEKQLQLKDQQAMTAAMQEWGQSSAPKSGSQGLPDYSGLIDAAKRHGASFNAIKGLQTSILDMQSKASTIAMNDARTGASNATAMKEKNGMIIDAINSTINAPDEQLPQQVMATANELYQKGLMDPQHVQMAQQIASLGDPAKIRQQLSTYSASLGGYSKMLDDAQKRVDLLQKQGKSDPNSPFYAPSDQAVAMGTAPGAAQINAGKTAQAARTAAAEAAARQPFELALARQRQALSQGDPNAAAQLLIDGDATLSELKARGSTPEFITNTLAAARRLSNGQYNAQQAESEFNVAKSPANLAFFGSAKSLIDKGGTLDQLAEIGRHIPQNQIPAFNTLADWEKAATGSGPIAEYASRALGVADDYAKVMGGGQGSDTSRLQALKVISANLGPEGRAGALNGIRGSVNSQIKSRIGNNKVLQRMYGDSEGNATATYKLTATGPGNHKIGSNDNGQTWYDVQTGQAVR